MIYPRHLICETEATKIWESQMNQMQLYYKHFILAEPGTDVWRHNRKMKLVNSRDKKIQICYVHPLLTRILDPTRPNIAKTALDI